MRLLNTKTLELEEFSNDHIPIYAILSHTWGEDEVTYEDMKTGKGKQKSGYSKLRMSCAVSAKDGFEYIWIDTCCIDKTSSAELSESINSMYKWYQDSIMCYAYLADVSLTMEYHHFYWGKDSDFAKSRWFTRGWTLQELIAPALIVFLDQKWDEIGTKSSLEGMISKVTGIPPHILAGEDPQSASIAQRMSWASRRRTTRIEDIAYCLIGLFGISMPLLYGEGKKAFTRLQEEIMKISDDHSIFAWESNFDSGGILATSPAAFSSSSNIVPDHSASVDRTISVSNKGVHLTLQLVEHDGDEDNLFAVLPCTKDADTKNKKRVAVTVSRLGQPEGYFVRTENIGLEFLDENFLRDRKKQETYICVRQSSPTQKNVSPLSKAAAKGNLAVVELLLRQSVDIESRNEFLLERGADISSKDHFGRTALTTASENGHRNVIDELHKKDAYIWSFSVSDSSRPTLTRVIEEGDDSAVRSFLRKGIDIEMRDPKDGRTLLCIAAECGHETISKLLIERGADLEAQDTKFGRTPLIWAASNGQETSVRILLEAGAYLESRDRSGKGRSAMSWAAGNGHEAVVNFLVKKGADTDSRTGENSSPLHFAAENGHLSVVNILLRSGSLAKPGERALQRAARNGHNHVVVALIEGGTIPDIEGLTAAAENGHVIVVSTLLDAGVDPRLNGFDYEKGQPLESPLRLATRNGHEAVVKVLNAWRPKLTKRVDDTNVEYISDSDSDSELPYRFY